MGRRLSYFLSRRPFARGMDSLRVFFLACKATFILFCWIMNFKVFILRPAKMITFLHQFMWEGKENQSSNARQHFGLELVSNAEGNSQSSLVTVAYCSPISLTFAVNLKESKMCNEILPFNYWMRNP